MLDDLTAVTVESLGVRADTATVREALANTLGGYVLHNALCGHTHQCQRVAGPVAVFAADV